MPRLIPMSNGRWPLDRLIEREAALVRERWRGFWLRRKRPIGEP
jgi:hypothetical protein